ncbi:MAG: hypothetical protein ACRCV3_03365 [Desulfovibrionaceae bacterium]
MDEERLIDTISGHEVHVRNNSVYTFYHDLAFKRRECGVEQNKRKRKITVSLTTYSFRIRDLYVVIESLFTQTVKADKIILWLAEEEFTYEGLPEILKMQEQYGLEIAFCNNIYSYKKLIPTLKKYPEDIIITVDDDTMYPMDFIEELYSEYQEDPSRIYSYLAREMPRVIKGTKYINWRYLPKTVSALYVMPIGVGGVLYTVELLDEDIMKEDIFMKLAPKADDIWFKAMSLKKGVDCKVLVNKMAFRSLFVEIPNSQEISLWSVNMVKGKNDEQIQAVFEYYSLWDFIR